MFLSNIMFLDLLYLKLFFIQMDCTIFTIGYRALKDLFYASPKLVSSLYKC